MNNKKSSFLGGTCNNSLWRNKLIPLLEIDYFNPVVKNWNEEAYKEELKQREECDFCLYVITPKATGFYSIAELTEDSIKRPDKTIFCFLEEDIDEKTNTVLKFDTHQIKSLSKIGLMVEQNKALWFTNLEEIAVFLNKQ